MIRNLFLGIMVMTVVGRFSLPVFNYVLNYDYIVKNLCEQRALKSNACHGTCQLKKDLAKTQGESNEAEVFKYRYLGLDLFFGGGVPFFLEVFLEPRLEYESGFGFSFFILPDYYATIFRPPILG
ncbi:hypothetical protein [Bergeyella sp. RCAD1439]|uniref:hypothetical protein n=1 Tax=Bergeyella anatis TaxID=3113737 RepID=UPI002E173D21|nr:hypothetical protein [Bergeyella sp. RCAD1439]